jgi:hypothetical protein
VLGPQQREDGELEVIRFALEEFTDPLQLDVSEPESPVQGLFSNLRQTAILAVPSDGAAAAAAAPGGAGSLAR